MRTRTTVTYHDLPVGIIIPTWRVLDGCALAALGDSLLNPMLHRREDHNHRLGWVRALKGHERRQRCSECLVHRLWWR